MILRIPDEKKRRYANDLQTLLKDRQHPKKGAKMDIPGGKDRTTFVNRAAGNLDAYAGASNG